MFQFTEDCLLGNQQIDDEHRYLFELLNRLVELSENDYLGDIYAEIKELISDLEAYAYQHFKHEEAYMESIRDPELILQRVQHIQFKEKIVEFSMKNIDDEEEQQEAVKELIQFLAKWLYHHIIGSDLMIGKLPPLEEWMLRENPYEFTEEYYTGIDMIDREHRILFEIADRAHTFVTSWGEDNTPEDFIKLVDELKQYTKYHFADEEEYMRNINYDGYEAQKRAHDAFIARMDDIHLDQVEGDPQHYMNTLMEFLLSWLINHILHSDKQIPHPDQTRIF